MNNTYSFSEAFSNLSGIKKTLTSVSESLSQFTARYPINEIKEISRSLDFIPKSTLQQFERFNHIFDSTSLAIQMNQYASFGASAQILPLLVKNEQSIVRQWIARL